MQVVHDQPGLDRTLNQPRAAVLTMGALHEGHLALVRAARELAPQVVVTIFVNPLQFGPQEDLDRYPRDLDRDLALLTPLLGRDDVVFAPTVEQMYPHGLPEVQVRVGALGTRFEGAVRPGHFDAVATVVMKLLQRVQAQVAVFGAKDAQQVAVLRMMVRDLDLPVRVVTVPTVREADGLALSSRNAYLAPDDRIRATAIYRSLLGVQALIDAGNTVAAAVEQMSTVLAATVDSVDYLTVVDEAFLDVGGAGLDAAPNAGVLRAIVAARVGRTRLIDNIELIASGRVI